MGLGVLSGSSPGVDERLKEGTREMKETWSKVCGTETWGGHRGRSRNRQSGTWNLLTSEEMAVRKALVPCKAGTMSYSSQHPNI